MNGPKQKPIEMEDSDQLERDNLGLYHKEMDACIRASSILYARLFEHSERIRVADGRSDTRISTHN